ncbi:depupylase/deamidase Dop [Phycicoccus duodecadis]|uniref:Proteasome accessory factor A n=1 Tax=Phycicoccus duodecadis TaxID=173053 RepID=A0A2N3YEP9_9MICO|nr:depupylase/deamidase Dop [Phycicoccus duodecadis]PKW25332.1 proteasome accessory factor A [Phycicoccus duodecadis]
MTVHRVMGIETEYGIVVPGDPQANPMVASGDVVTAYARSRGIRPARASWDYADEAPLRDARGFDMGRAQAHPTQLTDELEDPTMANVVLTNGARLYVDHAHPEYSSPEVTTPRAAVTWDRAGELVMREAVERLATVPPGVNLYKNNADGKGVSYGTHENYLMSRATPFAAIVRHLTPFFVARQVMCGSGRVGIGVDSRTAGYQIAQRSDFFEVEVGLETTLKRPIINTRDEPHAVADKYRRLHVILGDCNHADVANLLKMGTTSLVLAMIEADAMGPDLTVRRPVGTLHEVSHDPTLKATLELADGRRLTAVELLWEYHDRAAAFVDERSGGAPDPDTAEVLHWWSVVLDKLGRDPMEARREVDWVAKLAVLEGYRERDGLGWADPRLKAVDLQWSDVRADRGIAHRLAATGRLEVLVDEAEVRRAVTEPPADTRAWFRGTCLARFPDDVVAASWDSVIFDVAGQRMLQRVPMLEPLRGTEAAVGEIVRSAPDAASLLRALAASADSGTAADGGNASLEP